MSLRPILIHPDPRLRKVCTSMRGVTAETRKLADDMLATMYDAPGIGLAAPQIGVLERIFVMDCNRDAPGDSPTVCINPQITWTSDETVTSEEGCLSIPDYYAEVDRAAKIRLSFLDLDGKPQEQEFDGQWAICAQHELDHLDGKLFIDYLGAVRRQMVTQKMKKLKRERARG
ncbi:peptide deformylase [Halovulum dunhuangense]|uniref:Peptide deformylase n=1 Tax=Halovulum dunhuangense TaxID=1505036 RepID=A0A849KWL3_9RHOB|nr:peptide deformylase [Halovulum dunhuangense]NNU79655.1 peptide deformylase [Halovulum dunhuangense]